MKRVEKQTPKEVSIVIPCYNCASSVESTWNSIKEQTLSLNFIECIFVNDASTDNGATMVVLRRIEESAPENIKIIDLDTNLRQGGARNIGITYAEGQYLQFLDADDTLERDACERLLKIANETGADLIQFNHRMHSGNQSVIRKDVKEDEIISVLTPEDRVPFLNSTKVSYGCTNKFYKMDLIRLTQSKFAEHVVYEEPLFVYPCFLYAKRIVLIKDALYHYELHQDSTVTSKIGIRLLDHPQVQFQLLKYCIDRAEIFIQYRSVIMIYFLWTYYCETLCFAGQRPDAVLPLEYFNGMQEVCKKIFPDWRENPLISTVSENVIHVLETIEKTIDTNEKLQELIVWCVKNL